MKIDWLVFQNNCVGFLHPFKSITIKSPRLNQFSVLTFHEDVRRGTYTLKQNPRANHKLLGVLFKHVFQEAIG